MDNDEVKKVSEFCPAWTIQTFTHAQAFLPKFDVTNTLFTSKQGFLRFPIAGSSAPGYTRMRNAEDSSFVFVPVNRNLPGDAQKNLAKRGERVSVSRTA